jgi:C-terminal processing protease CtpA/Prc
MNFNSLSSTSSGDGEMFYTIRRTEEQSQDQKEVIVLIKNHADHNVKDFFPAGFTIPDPPAYRTEVDLTLIKCNEQKVAIVITEFWNAANDLVRLQVTDTTKGVNFTNFQELSPFATLHQIVCGKGYAGIGVRLALDNGLIKVAQVIDGSPAYKSGLKVNDVIVEVNNEALSGVSLEQAIEKLRGPANTEVILAITRIDRADPLKIRMVRENIPSQSSQLGAPQ